MMNILIDINHPGQVHLFRNLYNTLRQRGHKVIVTVKDIPAAIELLEIYDIPYRSMGAKSKSIIGKGLKQLKYDFRLWKTLSKERIDVAIGSSITADHACFFTKARSVHFSDDDPIVVPFVVKYAHPFTDLILCPDVITFPRHSYKVVQYPSYHELAYLHPDVFTPDSRVLAKYGIDQSKPYFILRFNAFKAHHDVNNHGLSYKQKKNLIETLQPFGNIYITSEAELEPEFSKYKLKISPEKIHSLLAYAKMFLGDSQTMTSEAAVLGIPALRCNSFAGRISYLEEQEKKYGLTYAYMPNEFDRMILKVKELLARERLEKLWQSKREAMLKDKMNVIPLFVWIIENISNPSFVKSNATKYINELNYEL